MIEFKLPDIGEGVAEGEIVKWLVAEGAEVDEHQAVVEVMTDKATVEIPAPASGRISRLMAAEGDVVPVGQPIFQLDEKGAGASPAREQRSAAAEKPRRSPPPPNRRRRTPRRSRRRPRPSRRRLQRRRAVA